MEHEAILDARPIDYREGRPTAVALGADLRARLPEQEPSYVRVSTARGRTVVGLAVGAEDATPDGTVRLDRFMRQSLKAFPHERLTVTAVEPPEASEVALVPGIDLGARYDPTLVPSVRRALAEQAVALRAGMLLSVRLPGGLAGVTYEVHFVEAAGAPEGVVTDRTTIWMVDPDHEHGPEDHDHDHSSDAERVLDTTFEDVGGLGVQLREVREFVELPLVFPQVYRQLGINPPRGVIFHGAPGTGKTLLARSVANEVAARLFTINGPEVVGTFSGRPRRTSVGSSPTRASSRRRSSSSTRSTRSRLHDAWPRRSPTRAP